MAIKLTDFITTNITRDTVISSGRNKTVAYLSDTVKEDGNKVGSPLVYTSLMEVSNAVSTLSSAKLYPTTSDVYKACKVFFDCGGRSILLVQVPVDIGAPEDSVNLYLDKVKSLPLEVIAFTTKIGTDVNHPEGTTTDYNGGLLFEHRKNIIDYLDRLEVDEGTSYRKLFALDIIDIGDVVLQGSSVNVMYKLVEKVSNGTVMDERYFYSCMSILAHLSRIDLNKPATISDYCFTEEKLILPVTNETSFNWQDLGGVANVVLDIFGGVPTNFGGNTGGGTDLVEEYMTIFIAQDVLFTELNLLKLKLKSGNAIARVDSALVRTLEVYYQAGFLVQTIYSGEDIIINKNGVNYTVLSKGSVITGGYVINILPINSRTQTEVNNRNLPDVHLIFNTAKGIRKINNVGKIV